MIMNMYTVCNTRSGIHDGVMLFRTHEDAVYTISSHLPKDKQAASVICHVGSIDIIEGIVTPAKEITTFNFPPPAETGIANAPQHLSEVSFEDPQVQERKFQSKIADIKR